MHNRFILLYLIRSLLYFQLVKQKKKINIGVHGYLNWLGRGTILLGGDRNTNECGGGNFFILFILYSVSEIEKSNTNYCCAYWSGRCYLEGQRRGKQ
jgi:hypothetical protein